MERSWLSNIVSLIADRSNPKAEKKVPLSAAQSEFMAEGDIKDFAVRLALKHRPLESGIEHLEIAHGHKLRAIENQYEPELERASKLIGETKAEIEGEKSKEEKATEKKEALKQERYSLNDKVQGLRLQIYVTIQEIRKNRLKKEKDFFVEEEDRLREAENRSRDEVLRDIEDQIEIAKRLYALDKVQWDINKPEFDRRVKTLEKEQGRVDDDLSQAQGRATRLKDIGVSRTTASFLIWAGYASLAGVGGVVATLLKNPSSGQTDYLSIIFQWMANVIRPFQNAKSWGDLAGSTLAPIAAIFALLAVTGGLTWLMDKILKRFDKTWLESIQEEDEAKESRGRRSHNKKDRRRGQAPFITPEINRLSIALPNFSRKAYMTFLASFPYLFLAGVVILLALMGGQPVQPNQPAGQPQGSAGGIGPSDLSIASIGTIFTLLTVSVSILYATNVIEPRWRNMTEPGEKKSPSDSEDTTAGGQTSADKDKEKAPRGKYIRAHWEFLAIMFAMLLALVFAAVLPEDQKRDHIIWGGVAAFMCFSSMGLAYGIVQRGIFREIDYLEGKRNIYRSLIEKYSTQPTIMDVFESFDPKDLGEALAKYRQKRHEVDELRLLHELKRLYADNYIDDREVLGFWSRLKQWAEPLRMDRPTPFKKFELTEPDLIDYEIAPEETRAINQCRDEARHFNRRLDEVATEMSELERIKSESVRLRKELEKVLAEREKEKDELNRIYEMEKAQIQLEREKQIVLFENAFLIGSYISDFLEGEK